MVQKSNDADVSKDESAAPSTSSALSPEKNTNHEEEEKKADEPSTKKPRMAKNKTMMATAKVKLKSTNDLINIC